VRFSTRRIEFEIEIAAKTPVALQLPRAKFLSARCSAMLQHYRRHPGGGTQIHAIDGPDINNSLNAAQRQERLPMRKPGFLLVATGPVLLALFTVGCETSGFSRADQNIPISVSYGEVVGAEVVDLQSDVGRNATIGALVGGLIGLATGQNFASAAAGAGLGAAGVGLSTRAAEGSQEAVAYVIRDEDGRQSKIVTEDKHLIVGDCVAVETGRTANLRRVSQEMCGPRMDHSIESELRSMHQEEAQECDGAKQELLEAQSDADIDAAVKKVRVLCKH